MQGKRAIKKSLNLQFDGRFIGKLAFYQFTYTNFKIQEISAGRLVQLFSTLEGKSEKLQKTAKQRTQKVERARPRTGL